MKLTTRALYLGAGPTAKRAMEGPPFTPIMTNTWNTPVEAFEHEFPV